MYADEEIAAWDGEEVADEAEEVTPDRRTPVIWTLAVLLAASSGLYLRERSMSEGRVRDAAEVESLRRAIEDRDGMIFRLSETLAIQEMDRARAAGDRGPKAVWIDLGRPAPAGK